MRDQIQTWCEPAELQELHVNGVAFTCTRFLITNTSKLILNSKISELRPTYLILITYTEKNSGQAALGLVGRESDFLSPLYLFEVFTLKLGTIVLYFAN